MALSTANATIQTARGYGRRLTFFKEVADGIRPPLEAQPVDYLPVTSVDTYYDLPKVMPAGVIVAWSTLGTEEGLTFANGGTAAVITYAARDVYNATDPHNTFMIEDIDNLGSIVTAAGAAVTNDPINLPLGYASYDIYSHAVEAQCLNLKLQDKVGIVCDILIEIPMLTAHQRIGARALVDGCLVCADPGSAGVSVRWLNATDSVEQIIGRCMKVDGIGPFGGMDRAFTTRGLGLPGSDNGGIEAHLDHTNVTHRAMINVTLA